MSVGRFFRKLFGLVLLAGFVFCCYKTYQVSPKLLEPGTWKTSYLVDEQIPVNADPQPVLNTPEAVETAQAQPAEQTPAPTPEPEATPALDPDSPAGRAAALGLPAPPEIDVDSWEFVLANEYNILGENCAPQGPATLEGKELDERIVEPMKAMIADTRAQNLSVVLSSGYRSYADQRYLFNRKVAQYPPEGKDSNGKWIVLPPGTSEHQTGLGADITDQYYEFKDRSLENTAMYQYMSRHCQEFGFIVRYPADKEDVTGVMYEPWHFRYVGEEAAAYIMENGLCLEEFLSLYREIGTAENPITAS